jgi:hypothetical protein
VSGVQLSGESIVFGDPSDFAIEAGEDGFTQHLWGHMCVYCHGLRLGDPTDPHCGMAGAADGFRRLATELLDSLWHPAFDGLSDQDLWNFLDARLYGYHGDVAIDDGRTLEQTRADSNTFNKFDFLTNWDEMFDGHKAFLLCPPGGPVRILCRQFPADVGLRVDVSKAGVIRAATDFLRWHDERSLRGE